MDSSLQVGLIGNLLCEVFARLPELLAGCHGYQQWSSCKLWWCPAVYMSAVVCAEWPICPAQGSGLPSRSLCSEDSLCWMFADRERAASRFSSAPWPLTRSHRADAEWWTQRCSSFTLSVWHVRVVKNGVVVRKESAMLNLRYKQNFSPVMVKSLFHPVTCICDITPVLI